MLLAEEIQIFLVEAVLDLDGGQVLDLRVEGDHLALDGGKDALHGVHLDLLVLEMCFVGFGVALCALQGRAELLVLGFYEIVELLDF